MEDLLRAAALGIVQGLTEFLPISSSGHLIITRELFGWDFADDLTFDVALHLGTTLALLVFFWREWLQMLRGGLRWLAAGGHDPDPVSAYGGRLLFLLLIGAIPAAVVGLIFDSWVEEEVRSPLVVGVMLLAFGFVLLAAENLGRRLRAIDSCGWRDVLWIGAAQAVSLVPGVSRAGVTISAALGRDFTRQEAARLSFLLATPVIVGAGTLKLGQALVDGIPSEDIGTILVGATVAAAVGWLAIRYLLRLVQRGTYLPFVAYRLLAGVFVLVYFAT
jgi:undecaprenyl-diphosphatase